VLLQHEELIVEGNSGIRTMVIPLTPVSSTGQALPSPARGEGIWLPRSRASRNLLIEEDHEMKLRMAGEVKTLRLRLLEECHVIVALADWNDTGVAFEIGHAHRLGKPMILISRGNCLAANAMPVGAADPMIDDTLHKSAEGEARRVSRKVIAVPPSTGTPAGSCFFDGPQDSKCR
jgi:hypothetical protein